MADLLPQSQSTPPATIDGELGALTDTRRPMRIGLWTLALAFGGFLLWAAFAPLDEGVPTQGTVSIDSKRKTVQHMSGGLISEILVREGDMVSAGQVLIRLDAANSKANYETIHQHYMGLSAMESRLLAVRNGAASIDFSPEVLQSNSPMVQQQVSTQRTLFAAQRAALDAELRGLRESILGQEASIRGYEGQLQSNRDRLALLNDELAGIRDLVGEGYAPRNRQMELERQVTAVQGTIAELQSNIHRAHRAIAELQQRIVQRQQEYRRDADNQLAQIRLQLQADREKFLAATNELERMEIRAPVAGQVVGLAVHTVGGVIQPAQKLMDIVPLNETLLLETRVPPHLIDRIAAGQPVDIRFSAFAHSPALVVEGKLETISQDLVTEQTSQGNVSYYLARISVTHDGMKTLGDRKLQPGMPAEVIIKTGERSMLTYLLHPLIKRMAASMKEE